MEFNVVSPGFDAERHPFHINIHLHSNYISQRSPWRYAMEVNMIIVSIKQFPHGMKKGYKRYLPQKDQSEFLYTLCVFVCYFVLNPGSAKVDQETFLPSLKHSFLKQQQQQQQKNSHQKSPKTQAKNKKLINDH